MARPNENGAEGVATAPDPGGREVGFPAVQSVHQAPPGAQGQPAPFDVLADPAPGRPYHYLGQTFIGAEADAHRRLDARAAERAGLMAELARLAPPPSAERVAELEALGYDFGLEREDGAAPSAEWSTAESEAFERGRAAGLAEWTRRLEVMFSSSDYDDAFPASRVTDADLFPGGWG